MINILMTVILGIIFIVTMIVILKSNNKLHKYIQEMMKSNRAINKKLHESGLVGKK